MTPANVLGLGWACTPAGLKAMEELAKLEAERGNPEYLEGEQFKNSSREQEHFRELQVGKGAERDFSSHSEKKFRDDRYIQRQKNGAEYALRRDSISGSRRASNEMCIFLILNISSLQLIPVNMIAYRSQYGSANPTAIIVPAITATLVSTFVAIVYCKVKDRGGRKI